MSFPDPSPRTDAFACAPLGREAARTSRRPTHGVGRRSSTAARVLARLVVVLTLVGAMAAVADAPAHAQEVPEPGPTPVVTVPSPDDVPGIGITVDSPDGALSRTVTIVLLLTLGSIVPALMMLMTSFTRFLIVLSLTRNAIGIQTIPPGPVLIGLALFLTMFVMGPVVSEVNENALQPLLAGEIGAQEAFEAGYGPLREFMLTQVGEDDLRLFTRMAGGDQPATPEEIPASTLVPAFVVSELRTAFVIGFVIFVPFLVIDLIVSAVLMSLGMVMLPPIFISLPIKLLLFVLVDGWALIIGSVVRSVGGVG